MTNEEIKEVLALHKVWLDSGGAEGKRADLTGAYLGRANLRGVDLWKANLSGAILSGANLNGADLGYADLRRADLMGAILSGANLNGASLTGAKVTLELSEARTLYDAKVSEEHLPWLAGRPRFGKELPTLTIDGPV